MLRTKYFKRKKRGFTIAEILVVLVILSVIMSMALGVYRAGSLSFTTVQIKLSLYSQARLAMMIFTREMMLSSHFRVFPEAAGVRFSIPVVKANGDLYTTATGDLRWGDGAVSGNSIRYVLSGGNLVRMTLDKDLHLVAGTDRILARNVANFSVGLVPGSNSQYQVSIALSLNNDQVRVMPQALNYALSTIVTPQN